MNEEIELSWLKLADGSELVLTRLRVLQQKNRGVFGEALAMIPLAAVTAVRLSWHRSRVLLGAGVLLLLLALVVAAASHLHERASAYIETLLSTPIVSLVQYGSILGAIAVFLLFWFYKQSDIQIAASTETLGGTVKSYEEAKEFCRLLLSDAKEVPPAVRAEEKKTEEKKATAEAEWRL